MNKHYACSLTALVCVLYQPWAPAYISPIVLKAAGHCEYHTTARYVVGCNKCTQQGRLQLQCHQGGLVKKLSDDGQSNRPNSV